MSDELKSTQIYYGENVLMMRVDDCLIFGNKDALRRLAEKLTKLPSAEPERKKGRWIYDTERVTDGLVHSQYHCSNCGFQVIGWIPNYCQYCGTDMRGE